MWKDLFRSQRTLTRLEDGPWGPYLEEFSAALAQGSYSVETMRRSLSAADHFGRWLLAQDFTLADADERKVEQYRGTLGRCASGAWPHRTNGLNLAMRFLMDKGVAHECTADSPVLPVEQWLRRFDDHLQRVVGSAPSTRQRYRPLLSRFLMNRFGHNEPDWSHLSADDLTRFVQTEAARAKGFGRKVPGVALRSFLRFLTAEGLVRDGLTGAIPSPRQYLHATLPARATSEQVAAVLACCQDGTAVGLRDHAVLLLLARLGVRALEITRLTLEDLDWKEGRVRIRAGKTHRERVLPLSEEVGSALASYLRHGRPPTAARAVFLDAQPPNRPWCGASAVSQLAHRRLMLAGFPAQPWRGAHLFRHTIASQMVNAGATFKDVADVLGHQSLATTSIYAKLDFDTLANVALPCRGGAR
jgi:site-specific recombinase XerD